MSKHGSNYVRLNKIYFLNRSVIIEPPHPLLKPLSNYLYGTPPQVVPQITTATESLQIYPRNTTATQLFMDSHFCVILKKT